jgi:glycosyltransferase involved in cell wall biosynthesis
MINSQLVSVIIPTYNRAGILRNAIESALKQTYTNIQILVIDDGSTDNTAEIVKEYPQAEYITIKHAGQAAARNCGLKNAKGAIIASLDSDDIWEPDFLTKCVTKLEQDNLDFVFANWLQYTAENNSWDFLIFDPFLQNHIKNIDAHNWVNLTYADARKLYLVACPSPSSSVVIRKSSIVSGWDERIKIGDDWCMYLDVILAKECKIAFTLDLLWKKRIDAINIYDGRKRNEVLKYLYIADTKLIMEKFRHLLTADEMWVLEQRYIASLVELAKHESFRELNFIESVKLLRTAIAIDVNFTFKMIQYILKTGLTRKMNPANPTPTKQF